MDTATLTPEHPATTIAPRQCITVIRLPVAGPANPLERIITTVARVDLALADALHDGDDIRPYSIVVRPNALDVIAFDDALAMTILRGDPAARLITRVTAVDLSHPDDATTWRIPIAFETPTHFRVAGFEHQLPDTFSVINSLGRRWDALGWEPLSHIRADRIPVWPRVLRWDRYQAAGNSQRGFTGVIHLDTRPLHDDERASIWKLCRFGTYRGVGKHTGYGMGRIRLLADDERWEPGQRLAPWDQS